MMAAPDVSAAIRTLDDIAEKEYKTSFANAIRSDDEALQMRRIARITGIELKTPFAEPKEIAGPSRTGALREWHLKPELLGRDATRALESLQGDPGYKFVRTVFEELRGAPSTDAEFLLFLEQAHNESNWFYSVLEALQPYLCEPPANVGEPPGRDVRRRQFWEAVRVAAHGAFDKGIEMSVASVMTALTALVPWIAFAPGAVVFGLSVFIAHYAKKGYCSANFQNEMLSILRYDGDFERR